MNDCSNADIRDRLPDLLHEHLDAASRAMVVAHVAACIDCRDELELLRSVHKTLSARTPRVDIAYVVNALPKPPARRTQVQLSARRRWSDWRIAAGVTVLIAGGSSLVISRRAPSAVDTRPPIVDTAGARLTSSPSVTTAEIPAPTASTPAPSTVTPSVATTVATNDVADSGGDEGSDGRFAGLNNAQMQTLLKEIDQLKPVPVTEPEPVTIRVDLKPSGPQGVR